MSLISRKHRWASYAMLAVFAGYCVSYPLNMLILERPGWIWDHPARNEAMEHMLVVTYFCWGAFFLYGARDPLRYLPLIDFTIVANIAHATIMLIDAIRLPGHEEHLRLGGDVLGTYLVPVILIVCHPRRFYLGGLFTRARD
jgi:hypothetical protein